MAVLSSPVLRNAIEHVLALYCTHYAHHSCYCSNQVLSVVEQQLLDSKAMQTRKPNPGQENLHTVLFEVITLAASPPVLLSGLECETASLPDGCIRGCVLG